MIATAKTLPAQNAPPLDAADIITRCLMSSPPWTWAHLTPEATAARTPGPLPASASPQRSLRWAPLRFAALLALVLAASFALTGPAQSGALDVFTTFAWSAYAVVAVWGVRGAFHLRALPETPSAARTSEHVDIVLPTILRASVLPALFRVIDACLVWSGRHLDHFTIEVVTEAGAEGIDALAARYVGCATLHLVIVPADYRTSKGTRFKARANEYALELARAEGRVGSDRWRYHLDDDTAPGPGTFAAIAEFINANPGSWPLAKHLAQGVLTFPHQLAPSIVPRLLDAIRPSDDRTRFAFFTGAKGTPRAGLHGEHLLVRASVEDAIGWDFGPSVSVEDAYFGLTFAARYPGRSAFLPAYCYGASPANVTDLLRQRRRWAQGLLALLFDRTMPLRGKAHLSVFILGWTVGVFQYVGVVLAVALVTGESTSPVARAVVVVWAFSMTYQAWSYLEGMAVNLAVSHHPTRRSAALHYLLILPSMYTVVVLESVGSILGAWQWARGVRTFDVIAKGR